ncbi:MAG: anthranilate synthase component I, partial [Ruminococcus sp.]
MQETVITTSLEDVKKIAESGDYKVIPIKAEMYSDMKTPIQLMSGLRNASHHCFILESVDNTKRWGRYTFLGYDPILEVTCTNGFLQIKDKDGNTEFYENANPKTYIENILKEYKSPKLSDYPTFTGGLAGYFSYDYIKYAEPSLNLDAEDNENFK